MNEEMYSVLEKIYDEYFDIFQFESFHYGGDEVNLNCWNSSALVTKPMQDQNISLKEEGFIQIWTNAKVILNFI